LKETEESVLERTVIEGLFEKKLYELLGRKKYLSLSTLVGL
jgi:uncharacterized protein YjaZ